MQETKRLVISNHARERWLQRVIDPQRYNHLLTCRQYNCDTCSTLIHNIRNIIVNNARSLDANIARRYRKSTPIEDKDFLEAIKKLWPEKNCTFSVDDNAVFIVSEKEDICVLCSILSRDMIDGTIIKAARTKEEQKEVFNKWKFANRSSKNSGKVPRI